MINPQNIDDQLLGDLLGGKLSRSQELELELIIASNPQVQSRLEELAGASKSFKAAIGRSSNPRFEPQATIR
jgi:hypothetical protein